MGDAAPGGPTGRGRGGGSRMRGGKGGKGGGRGGKGGGAPGGNGVAPTTNNGNMASLPFQDPAIMAVGSGPPPPVGQQLFGSAVPLPVPLGSSNGAPNGLGAGPNSFGNGKANPASRTSSTTRAHLTETTFASLPISALTKRAIAEVLCYDTLTKVQAETLPLALQGIDLIAKARTGTGKTVAFLLPTIERLLAAGARPGAGVQAVAISPTRELASQIQVPVS